MLPNAEPIEIAIAGAAFVAFVASVGMLVRSWRGWRTAIRERHCDAIRTLAWMRVRNEVFRLLISASVVYSGYVQAMSPLPPNPSPTRPIFQGIWLGIALICLLKSVLNERDTRHVVTVIERERAAGWPR